MLNVAPGSRLNGTRQPIFNLPPAVAWIAVALLAVHGARVFLLGDDLNLAILLRFAFIPLAIAEPETLAGLVPTGITRVATFLTYAFLHADWSHVLLNTVWLAAFGAPVARRFGARRFLGFAAIGAIAGAAVHFAIAPDSPVPLVGASAAVSALMAGAARFVFSGPGWIVSAGEAVRRPALDLGALMGNRRVLAFLGVWFGLNLLFGLTSVGTAIASGAIAWEAHIGGFLAGLFLFRVFDPVPRA